LEHAQRIYLAAHHRADGRERMAGTAEHSQPRCRTWQQWPGLPSPVHFRLVVPVALRTWEAFIRKQWTVALDHRRLAAERNCQHVLRSGLYARAVIRSDQYRIGRAAA